VRGHVARDETVECSSRGRTRGGSSLGKGVRPPVEVRVVRPRGRFR
jgi:hypothetical protein